jgi:hypothetical protein
MEGVGFRQKFGLLVARVVLSIGIFVLKKDDGGN